jgi:hypothetical protein
LHLRNVCLDIANRFAWDIGWLSLFGGLPLSVAALMLWTRPTNPIAIGSPRPWRS